MTEDRLGQDSRYWLDSSAIKRDVGWEPQISWEEGLKEMVELGPQVSRAVARLAHGLRAARLSSDEMERVGQQPEFDAAAARQRCLRYRRRILEVSQQVTALHIAPAFSCLEMVDVAYHGLMRHDAASGKHGFRDSFVMSKGHGCLSQYVILEDLGVLLRDDLDGLLHAGRAARGSPRLR